jgi:diguanylate cyclase (GGDEF)-like protein
MATSESGRALGSPQPVEDSFFELLIDTLEGLDRPARGLFLQRLLKSLTQLDLTESQSLETWERIIARRQELSRYLGRPVALKTAMVDALASSNLLRAPILMEYEEMKKLQLNAATDALTGLDNRRLFEEYFERELNRAKRYGLSLALIVLDLRVFKMVNDRYGHPRGDQVLQLAATTLQNSMRTTDFAFRIGGDEFALLLPQADVEQAATLGRRIQANFASVIQPQKMGVPIGVDFGLAVYPQDGDQPDVLRRVADERLYRMKYAGREPGGGPARTSNVETRREDPSAYRRAETSANAPQVEPVRPEATQSSQQAENSGARETQSVPVASAQTGSERRKWERISMAGKKAFAKVHTISDIELRVLDMSHGGVALEGHESRPLDETFHALLHVPILGEVRVKLKKVYVRSMGGQQTRVGCLFVI